MNLAPSTEGALAATEQDRLPRCACTHASQADEIAALSRTSWSSQSSAVCECFLSHRNVSSKLLRVTMTTIAADMTGAESGFFIITGNTLWLAHLAHVDHSIAHCRSSVLHSAVGDNVHGPAHLPHHEAHSRVREARRDSKPPRLH